MQLYRFLKKCEKCGESKLKKKYLNLYSKSSNTVRSSVAKTAFTGNIT